MQNVLIEKPYRFVPRIKAAWPQSLYCRLGLYKREIRRLWISGVVLPTSGGAIPINELAGVFK